MRKRTDERIKFQLRINLELQRKIKVIAMEETRNLNSQIEYMLKRAVANYEAEFGPIDTSRLPDDLEEE